MRRMISICLTWFPIGGLREPNIYHDLGDFTIIGDFTWWGVEEGSQFFHEIRLQFLLSLTPFQILILLVSLDVLFHHQLSSPLIINQLYIVYSILFLIAFLFGTINLCLFCAI